MKTILYNYGLLSCLCQMVLISIATIGIVAIVKHWYKPLNKKKYEWLTIVLSFALALVIDILMVIFFKIDLFPTVVIEEVSYMILTPVITKLMYDTYKALLKGGKDDKRNDTYTSIQTAISDNSNN